MDAVEQLRTARYQLAEHFARVDGFTLVGTEPPPKYDEAVKCIEALIDAKLRMPYERRNRVEGHNGPVKSMIAGSALDPET